MGVNPNKLSKILLVAFAVGAMATPSVAQQTTSESSYLISHPVEQPLYQPTYATPDLQGQPVQAPIGEQASVVTTVDCGGDTECGCDACQASAKPAACAGSHKGLFYNNDFSYLNDDCYTGSCFGDRFKQIPVGRCGTLDLGGQLRFRYHNEKGMAQQAGFTRFEDTNNEFLLSRLRLYANWQVNNRLRFFIEGIHSDIPSYNDEYIARGIDKNYGDLLNAFADIDVADNMTFRVGRQELLFGAQRLISPLDWANTRRTFDGVRMMSNHENISIDAFYTQAVPVVRNQFDSPNEDLDFFGTYVTFKGMENKTLDLYALGLNNDAGARQTENFVTYGSRLFGSTKRNIMYETEGMVQTGRNNIADSRIFAYAFTSGMGYQFKDACWKPTIWAYYDYATGESPSGSSTQFNDLFPLAHKYLGFIDAVQRRNIQSPNARLTMAPSDRLSLLFWYYNFEAEEPTDPIPSLGGTPAQDPNSRDFGNELDFTATYQVSARSSVLGGYSHFWRGARILGDTDADFFYLQWTTNF